MTPKGRVSPYRKFGRLVSFRRSQLRMAWSRSRAGRLTRRHARADIAAYRTHPQIGPGTSARRERTVATPWQSFALALVGLCAPIILGIRFGAAVFLVAAVAVGLVHFAGVTRARPWQCGNCKRPLATAMVRVCPSCGARLTS